MTAPAPNGSAAPILQVRDLVKRPPAVVFEDSSLREAADHMVQEGVGRLPVVSRSNPRKPIGILTRSDLLAAHQRRLDETHVAEQRDHGQHGGGDHPGTHRAEGGGL